MLRASNLLIINKLYTKNWIFRKIDYKCNISTEELRNQVIRGLLQEFWVLGRDSTMMMVRIDDNSDDVLDEMLNDYGFYEFDNDDPSKRTQGRIYNIISLLLLLIQQV